MDEVLGELPEGSRYRRVVACRRGMLEEGISLIEAATMPGTNRPGLGRGIKAGRPRRIHPEVEALIVLRRWEGASIRRITAELDAAGLPTPGNRSWQYSTVQRVIDRHPELASAPTAPRRRRSRRPGPEKGVVRDRAARRSATQPELGGDPIGDRRDRARTFADTRP